MAESDIHSRRSSYREMLLEHLLAGEVMQHLWVAGVGSMEILKPQVDDSGYDLVLETGGIVRHVQLKSSFRGSKVRDLNVSLALASKPSGCVVLVRFDPKTLALGPFGYFGGAPGQRLPDLAGYKMARHTKGDATGLKKFRPNLKCVPISRFEMVNTVKELTTKLFGRMSAV